MTKSSQNAKISSTNDAAKYWNLVKKGPLRAHPYVIFLGLRAFETQPLIKRIDAGLSYAAFLHFQRNIDLPVRELAELIQISVRTLQRRKEAGKLEPDESDRLVRLSRVYGKILELFEGDEEAAKSWLSRKQIGLGGAKPLDLIKSEVGAKEVENLIGRLEHGVFS